MLLFEVVVSVPESHTLSSHPCRPNVTEMGASYNLFDLQPFLCKIQGEWKQTCSLGEEMPAVTTKNSFHTLDTM